MIVKAWLRMTATDIVVSLLLGLVLLAVGAAGYSGPLPAWLVIAVALPLVFVVYHVLFAQRRRSPH